MNDDAITWTTFDGIRVNLYDDGSLYIESDEQVGFSFESADELATFLLTGKIPLDKQS